METVLCLSVSSCHSNTTHMVWGLRWRNKHNGRGGEKCGGTGSLAPEGFLGGWEVTLSCYESAMSAETVLQRNSPRHSYIRVRLRFTKHLLWSERLSCAVSHKGCLHASQTRTPCSSRCMFCSQISWLLFMLNRVEFHFLNYPSQHIHMEHESCTQSWWKSYTVSYDLKAIYIFLYVQVCKL